MTNTEMSTLVFKDQAGGYYLVPRETLEQGRMPQERTAEIERLIAEQNDTQGYFGHLIFLGSALIGFAAEILIGYSGGWESGGGRGPLRPL